MSIITKVTSVIVPRIIDILHLPVLGKPLIEWFKLLGLYSFIVWFSFLGFKVYQHYTEYAVLKNQEKSLYKNLKKKEKILNKYRNKIKDLQLAYREVSKYFAPIKVRELMENINKRIYQIEVRKKDWYKNLINPYRLEQFNVKKKFYLPNYVEGITLTDTRIKPDSVKYFKLTMYTFYKKWRKYTQNQEKITVSTQVSYNKGLITLFLKRDKEGFLNLKPRYLEGVVSNLEKIMYIPASTTIDSSLLFKGVVNSQYFFGWDITLKKEGF
ncbi:MAG TPA: hypothetical protein EYO62_03390 [Aquificales bacterium]|nr:hypothetical protein [Aquificales bacterium]